MFILGNFFIAMAPVVDTVFTILIWIIAIRALISWVNPDPYNPIVQFLHQVTEPLLTPIRRFLPMSGIDFSPFIAALIIMLAKSFFVKTLWDIGQRLQ